MATTRRRNVHDEREALALLEELEDSGLELSAFCALYGVDGRSLNCWKHNLGRSRPGPKLRPQSLRLVEVVTSVSDESPSVAAYKLSVGGVSIEVDDHFRDETLARLLRVAATC